MLGVCVAANCDTVLRFHLHQHNVVTSKQLQHKCFSVMQLVALQRGPTDKFLLLLVLSSLLQMCTSQLRNPLLVQQRPRLTFCAITQVACFSLIDKFTGLSNNITGLHNVCALRVRASLAPLRGP